MVEIPRLNGVIRALEQGRPAITTFSPPEIGMAQAINGAPYDAVVFEMEHNPFDVQLLRNCMQYMLDRRQILESGSIAPAVTPMVRIPVNGGEMNQYIAKQVLDMGVYGIVWPHVSTVEEARNAVVACRYPRPPSAPYYEPPGQRGDAPKHAAPYWGLTQQEYYKRADVWPLNPRGEILVGIQCEEVRGIENLPKILEEVPGIGFVLIGEGDLSLDICKAHDVACGHPHANAKNIEALIAQGYRWLMTLPTYSFAGLEKGLEIGLAGIGQGAKEAP
jgi:4-hydroxy-2-oxoheptanedioate aldolase